MLSLPLQKDTMYLKLTSSLECLVIVNVSPFIVKVMTIIHQSQGRRGGGTPYNGIYIREGSASPKRGTFLRLLVFERVRISLT